MFYPTSGSGRLVTAVAALLLAAATPSLAGVYELADVARFPISAPGFAIEARGLTLDAQGRMTIVGMATAQDGTRRALLLRRLGDGTPDLTFGSGSGLVLVPIAAGETGHALTDVLVQSDGAIVAAGEVGLASGDVDAIVIKLTGDGVIDATFGDAGRLTFDFGADDPLRSDVALRMSIDGAGRLWLAGRAGVLDAVGGPSGGNVAAVARATAAGQLDPTFAGGGTRLVSFDDLFPPPEGGSTDARISAARLDGLGRWWVAGRLALPIVGRAVIAMRFGESGELDPGFANSGRYWSNFGFVTTSDGWMNSGLTLALSPFNGTGARAIRFSDEGTVDPSFALGRPAGFNGLAEDFACDISAWQTDGLLFAASVWIEPDRPRRVLLSAHDRNGALRPGFAYGGAALLSWDSSLTREYLCNEVLATADDRVIVLGNVSATPGGPATHAALMLAGIPSDILLADDFEFR